MALLQSQHAPPWAQRASQLGFPIFDDKLQQFPNANFFLLASGTDQLDQFCLTSWLLTKISLKLRDLSNDALLSPYWCSDLQKADEIVGWILSISVQSANRHVGYHQNFLHNRVAGRQISHMAIQTDSEIMDPFRQILDIFIFAFCTAWSPIWSRNYTHQKPFFMSFRNFLHRKKKVLWIIHCFAPETTTNSASKRQCSPYVHLLKDFLSTVLVICSILWPLTRPLATRFLLDAVGWKRSKTSDSLKPRTAVLV